MNETRVPEKPCCGFLSACLCLILLSAAASSAGEAVVEPSQAENEPAQSSRTATAGPNTSRSGSTPREENRQQYREPTASELQREPALRERVEARWAALIEGDLATAYQFSTPSFRANYTPAEYASFFGSHVQWHLASVKEVRYDLEDQAEVIVNLTLTVPLGGSGDFKTTVPTPERWSFVEGQWYFSTDITQATPQ